VILLSMDPSIAHKTEKMHIYVCPRSPLERIRECLVIDKLPRCNRIFNSGVNLFDDPPSSNIEMPHFAIAHLTFRESNRSPRGGQLT
jgi:hypothetical protein